MNKTTRQTILDRQELNRKLYNKENPTKKQLHDKIMNNKTTNELLQELNTMQNEHIKLLDDRIDVLQHTIEIDKITIKTQAKTIKLYIDNLNSKSNE